MARRMTIALGVTAKSLTKGGPLLTIDGSPYTSRVRKEYDTTFHNGELRLISGQRLDAAFAMLEVRELLKAAAVGNILGIACFLVREKVLELKRELSLEMAPLVLAGLDDFLADPLLKITYSTPDYQRHVDLKEFNEAQLHNPPVLEMRSSAVPHKITPPLPTALIVSNLGGGSSEPDPKTEVMSPSKRSSLPVPPLAEPPKTVAPPPASLARGSAGKASSSPRARVARKSRPRS